MLAWSSCTHGTHASHMYDYGFYIYVMKIELTFEDVNYFLHLVDKDGCIGSVKYFCHRKI